MQPPIYILVYSRKRATCVYKISLNKAGNGRKVTCVAARALQIIPFYSNFTSAHTIHQTLVLAAAVCFLALFSASSTQPLVFVFILAVAIYSFI